jgi:hypothetical protein
VDGRGQIRRDDCGFGRTNISRLKARIFAGVGVSGLKPRPISEAKPRAMANGRVRNELLDLGPKVLRLKGLCLDLEWTLGLKYWF